MVFSSFMVCYVEMRWTLQLAHFSQVHFYVTLMQHNLELQVYQSCLKWTKKYEQNCKSEGRDQGNPFPFKEFLSKNLKQNTTPYFL